MTNITSWQFQPDEIQNWACINGLFTPEECAQIIELGNAGLQDAMIAIDNTTQTLNSTVRESKVAWLTPKDIEFAYRRVTDAVLLGNKQFFNFDLFGMVEGFQFTRYDAPNGHYGLHIDKTLGREVRKLSLTIQLSSPEDYEGGDLALQFTPQPELMPKGLGNMVLFPSYVLHEVRPVTKGTRYSLVAWITGKPFK